jgi:hypothetical protein
MTDMLRLPLVLVACVGGFLLPLLIILSVLAGFEWLAGWWARAGERQQRIALERAEAHVRQLEWQLHRARTHLATLQRAKAA